MNRVHTCAAVAAVLASFAAIGCGGDSTTPNATGEGGGATSSSSTGSTQSDACKIDFSGIYDDAVATTACASLSGSTLTIQANSTKAMVQNKIQVELGATATPGTFTEATTKTWSAVGVSGMACEFSAGDESVPQGSFTLVLTDVTPAPHGTFVVTQLMHAATAPAVCPVGTDEQISAAF